MKLDITHNQTSADNTHRQANLLGNYLTYLQNVVTNKNWAALEASLLLPSQMESLEAADEIAMRLDALGSLKFILVIGVGGSNLGTKAVYDASGGFYDNLEPEKSPKILWLDGVYNQSLLRTLEFLRHQVARKEELAICIISESGSTIEPLADAEIILSKLSERFGTINDRVVVITRASSPLHDFASKRAIITATVPEKIGGRFAVLSDVGLIPLKLAGLDVMALRAGARAMRERCLEPNIETNPALMGATWLFQQYRQGVKIYDNFFFTPELESLGKWYRQLLGESVGKEKDSNNKTVNLGITPTVSIGSVDLHSVGQLYFSTPKDRVTTFTLIPGKSALLFPESELAGLTPGLAGKTPSELESIITQSVLETYAKHKMPYTVIELISASEHELGEYLQYRMIETMLLGELLNVNTFDQPNVEEYKERIRQKLSDN